MEPAIAAPRTMNVRRPVLSGAGLIRPRSLRNLVIAGSADLRRESEQVVSKRQRSVDSAGNANAHAATDRHELGIGDRVINGATFAAPPHDACPQQQREVAGNVRLRRTGGGCDCRYRLFGLADRVQVSQPRRLGQQAEIARNRVEDGVQLVGRLRC